MPSRSTTSCTCTLKWYLNEPVPGRWWLSQAFGRIRLDIPTAVPPYRRANARFGKGGGGGGRNCRNLILRAGKIRLPLSPLARAIETGRTIGAEYLRVCCPVSVLMKYV